MLKPNNILLLLCSIFIGISIQAAPIKKKKATTQEIKTKKADFAEATSEQEDNDTEDENDTEDTNFVAKSRLSAVERSKCHRLKKALVGERFDIGRVAAYLSSNAIGYGLQTIIVAAYAMKKLNFTTNSTEEELKEVTKQYFNNFGKNITIFAAKIGGTILAMHLASIAIHFGLLKKQNVSGVTSACNSICLNPTGLGIYSLLHRLVLNSNLMHVLETYDQDEIPACVKAKLTDVINEYESTKTLSMNPFQKSQFIIELLADLDKAIAR